MAEPGQFHAKLVSEFIQCWHIIKNIPRWSRQKFISLESCLFNDE